MQDISSHSDHPLFISYLTKSLDSSLTEGRKWLLLLSADQDFQRDDRAEIGHNLKVDDITVLIQPKREAARTQSHSRL